MDPLECELNEEQRLVRKMAHDFARDIVKPLARKVDHEHYFPQELIPELAKLGFLGVNVPSEYGGSGLDYVSYQLIVEELAAACASTSVVVSAHNSLCIAPILAFGSEEQKKKFLPKLASGEWLGCFALSEPGTGSDAARQTCTSIKKDDVWEINGVKNWITNGPVADVCILFTMESPKEGYRGINCFVVEMDAIEGLTRGKKEDKLGICGSPTCELTFENTKLTDEDMLGKSGDGFKVAMSTIDGGRIGIAAQAVGIARAAYEDAREYSKERHTFGKPISRHQTIRNYLADMSVDIAAARLLALSASRRKDAGAKYTKQAAQAKLFAADMAMKHTVNAVQIHGGYGFVREFNVERYMRDAKITQIYEGTSEIQRIVIADQIFKEN